MKNNDEILNNKKNIRTKLWWVFVIILMLCNPYMQYFGVGTDTDVQLYPVLISIIIIGLFIHLFKVPNLLLVYGFIMFFLFLLFILFFKLDAYIFFRGTFGYVSLFINSLGFYFMFSYASSFIVEKVLKWVFNVWVTIGVLQLFDFNGVLFFWRNRASTDISRGSVSLANEPAYFAIIIIMLSVCLIVINRNNIKYLFVSFLVSAFVAKSSVGTIFALALIVYSMKLKLRYILLISFIVSLVGYSFYLYMPDFRIARVLVPFIKDPMLMAYKDMSVGLRMVNLYIPVAEFFNNYFMPHGLTVWNEYLYKGVLKYFGDVSWINFVEYNTKGSGRMLSIHGQLIFELGIFAFVVYWLFYKISKFSNNWKLVFFTFFILGFNGLALNNPILGCLFGLSLSQKFQKKTIDCINIQQNLNYEEI